MSDIDETPLRRKSTPDATSSRGGLVVPWAALSILLVVLTLTAVAALVIVATISDAGALATVALVLAILSFGAQLVVTAAQTASANEQYRQVNRLYEDTRSVLQRIRAQSKMMLANQSNQFNKVLDHVLSPSAIESAVAEARGEGDEPTTPDEERGAVAASASEVSKLLRAEAERAILSDRERQVGPVRRPEPRREELRRFPNENEAREIAARFSALSEEAQGYIRETASRFNKNPNSSLGLQMARLLSQPISSLHPYFKELQDARFITLEPYVREGRVSSVRRLTPDGVIATRFFTGQGVVPPFLRDIVAPESEAEARPERSRGTAGKKSPN